MPEEINDVVDEHNNVIGKEKRSTIHSKGLFHRAVSIFIFNSKGAVFLQKRSQQKSICPLKWDLSAAESLKAGETYLQAAERGLKEELNVIAKLSKLRDAHLQKNEYFDGEIKDFEFVELHKAVYDGEIVVDKEEVADGRFFWIDDVQRMIEDDIEQFTPWFLDEWNYLLKAGFK